MQFNFIAFAIGAFLIGLVAGIAWVGADRWSEFREMTRYSWKRLVAFLFGQMNMLALYAGIVLAILNQQAIPLSSQGFSGVIVALGLLASLLQRPAWLISWAALRLLSDKESGNQMPCR